ncbi:hypothetical protein GCM10027589_14550 [Actinocorallia lasiicapitis]
MELKPVALYREMYGGEREEDLPSIRNASGTVVEPDRQRISDYMRGTSAGFSVMESVPVYLAVRPLVLPANFVEDVRDRGYVPSSREWTAELGAAVRRWR